MNSRNLCVRQEDRTTEPSVLPFVLRVGERLPIETLCCKHLLPGAPAAVFLSSSVFICLHLSSSVFICASVSPSCLAFRPGN